MNQAARTNRAAHVPLAPGSVPLLGHLPKLAARRVEFLQSLRGAGDIVRMRLGRRTLYVVNTPEAIWEVLVTQARTFHKGLLFDRSRPYVGNGIVTSDGEFHHKQRRAMHPAFHRTQIAGYGACLVQAAHSRVGSWPVGQVLAMEDEMRYLATEMLLTALFPPGKRTHHALEELGTQVSSHLKTFVKGLLRATVLPPALAAIPTPSRRRFLVAAASLRHLADSAVQQARSDPGAEDGMLALMLAGTDDRPGGMSDIEARDELLTLLIAGIETISTSLTWALHVLGTHPQIAEQVSREVHVAGPTADRTDTPYTQRFIQEVLRLHQPNWFLMRQALVPVRIGEFDLPAGAQVVYSTAPLHRDPALFPDPLRFDPDRWLTRSEKDLPRGAYIPFGAGNRKCIGDNFAWAEMLAALTTIVSLWQLHPAPGFTVRAVADAQIQPNALPMSVTPKEPR